MNDRVVVDASAADVMAVIVDLESYPSWADGVTRIEVLETDDDGRPLLAEFTVDAQVQVVEYTLRYDHSSPTRLTWKLERGEMLSQLDGVYDLVERDGRTEVDYSLEVDIALPLPGFLKKRAAKRILDTGLSGLKRRVEQG